VTSVFASTAGPRGHTGQDSGLSRRSLPPLSRFKDTVTVSIQQHFVSVCPSAY
jgi:hypothetical protein